MKQVPLSEVYEKPGDLVVVFGADWCGPCKNLAKIIEQLELLHDLAFTFVKIDADNMNNDELNDWDISSVPTTIVLSNGVEIGRRTGVPNKLALKDWLEEVFAFDTVAEADE